MRMTMSGRSGMGALQLIGEAGEQCVEPFGGGAADEAFSEPLQWVRADDDRVGQGDHGATGGWAEGPAAGDAAEKAGEPLNVVCECVRRVEFGDAFDECVAPELDAAGGADRDAVGAGAQQAGMVDEVGPRTDRAEVGEDVPD